jgi:creatinine deaminase
MPIIEPTDDDRKFMRAAYDEAKAGYDEGGLPIGAVLVEQGGVVARGHNRRIQEGDPIAHGEMDCLRRAGRRPSYRGVTLALLDDADCIELMARFIRENPAIWNEDIARDG